MGTNCAPLLADLLHDYVSAAMILFSWGGTSHIPKSFSLTRRYIDDLITINNPQIDGAIGKIYPSALTLKETNLSDHRVAYLDRHLEIEKGKLVMSLYDKRDYFPFRVQNYPHLDSNVPCMPMYGVYISQLLRFAHTCNRYSDFLAHHKRLARTLLVQGFQYGLLCRKFKQFYQSHYSLVQRYSHSMTQHVQEGVDSQTG